MPESKIYVLDANVLLYDPEALLAFPDAVVVLPLHVIEEIDKFKKVLSETGNNARAVSHMLDRFRTQGNLSQGITLPNKGQLRVAFATRSQEEQLYDLDLNRSSNRVLAVALQLQKQGIPTTLVTQDTNLRVKANSFDLPVIPYQEEKQESTLYTGIRRQSLTAEKLQPYRKKEKLSLDPSFAPHEALLLVNQDDPKDFLMWRFDPHIQQFHKVDKKFGVWSTTPRNPEQHLALELLMDPRIALVSLIGKAGTGKTLLALAAGLQLTLVEKAYTKMLVSRPIFPMGRDLGYLPGDIQEKLEPWMQPIYDNLDLLIGSSADQAQTKTKGYQELLGQGLLIIEPLTYIRGRSIPHQYMIVDEAQNLTPHEIKTIITRAGEGTKIVLTGDPHQIDNPYVNAASNGLSYVVDRFKPHKLTAHVTLVSGERSSLAELAANVL
ncbi:PhoH family protein [Deltaproteobacteria bacterium TL4]